MYKAALISWILTAVGMSTHPLSQYIRLTSVSLAVSAAPVPGVYPGSEQMLEERASFSVNYGQMENFGNDNHLTLSLYY
ncbi:hypothetical protein CPB86DRAFT_785167 [Serendipita vermifera]|nr:hypothetical protein CPB86DRAFT_785167 [Serendipita vermifera]